MSSNTQPPGMSFPAKRARRETSSSFRASELARGVVHLTLSLLDLPEVAASLRAIKTWHKACQDADHGFGRPLGERWFGEEARIGEATCRASVDLHFDRLLKAGDWRARVVMAIRRVW